MSFLFSSASTRQRDLALLALRVIAGIIFTAHGAQKLFVFGIAGVQGAFAQMGAPLPQITGPLIGGLEFFGGIALIVGLLTRLVALGLVADMLGAILLVHLAKGLTGQGGYEFVLMLMGASLALLLAGAGDFSIDAVIGRRTARR
jgi:putative oxidoreductase